MERTQYRDQPWLAELARWEWALAAAFDAADVEPLSLAEFSERGAIGWPELYLIFHPSLQVLRLRTNAALLNQQLADGVEVAAAEVLDTPQDWLIWREGLAVQYRPVSTAEACALAAVSTEPPETFADMCEALCEFHEAEAVPLIAAGMLKAWLTQGLIIAALPELRA